MTRTLEAIVGLLKEFTEYPIKDVLPRMDILTKVNQCNGMLSHARHDFQFPLELQHPPCHSSDQFPTSSQPHNTSSLRSYYTASYHWSSNTSLQSYYSADSSLSYSTRNSPSTLSSNMSFPYSVTSLNSIKSRLNVLYPHRAHRLPVAVTSEHFCLTDSH
jgi:hypothetical protein